MKCMVDARGMDALCCTLKNGDAYRMQVQEAWRASNGVESQPRQR